MYRRLITVLAFAVSPSLVAACGLALLAVLMATFAPGYLVTLASVAGLNALAAIGLTMLLISGQVSLGHAAYVGVGAYAAALAAKALAVPSIVAIGVGVVASGLVALVVGAVTLRLRGHYLPLATLAVAVAFSGALVAAGDLTGGASGLRGIPPLGVAGFEVTGERAYLLLIWLLAAGVAGGLAHAMHSRQGRALRALRGHTQVAEVFGVDTARLRLFVFVAAGMLAGLAGALYAFSFRFLSPAPFGLAGSFDLLIACVLGGAGHPFGAVLGAVAVAVVETLLQDIVARQLGLAGNTQAIVFGCLLIAVLLRWPGGIWAALSPFWPRFELRRPKRALEPAPEATGGDARPLLQVRDIGRRFGGVQALRGVSFQVGAREIVGLIGPNGAGKSTTFNVVTGLIRPDAGSVSLMGQSPPERVSALVSLGVARTFQHALIVPGMTVLENVALGAYAQGNASMLRSMVGLDRLEEAATFAKAWRALDVVGLDDVANELAGALPMGRLRLAEIARALVSRPRLLLLDEPAAGLRLGEKIALARLLIRLRRSGMSILLVEHDMDLVMSCVDRLVVLDRGSGLAQGTPAEIRCDERVVSAYLGA